MPTPKKTRKPYLSREEKEEIKDFFNSNGLTITQWAKDNGFTAYDCFEVIYREKRKCIRGKAHIIARKLKNLINQEIAQSA